MERKQKKLINFRPLFYCFVVLLLALATARYVFAGRMTYIVLVSVIFFGGGIYLLLRRKFAIALVLLATFAFGVGWHFVGMSTYAQNTYTEKCSVVGRVGDDLKYSNDGSFFYATLKDVKINGDKEKNISLQLWVDGNNVEAGDILSFESYVEKAKLFELGSFNNAYYRKHIGYNVSISEYDVMITGHKLLFSEKIRLRAKALLEQNMGIKNGNVAYAMLFGDKSDVDAELKEIYKASGIIHILAVSGLHISFLFAFLGFLLKKCRAKNWLVLLLCGIVWLGYAYLCGFSPSIIRAGIMGLVLLLAITAGKWYDNLNGLGLAGILILLVQPLSAFDVGFLMSFGCVFTIFILYPILTKTFKKFMPKYVADSFAISISAELGILPFLAKIFGSFNYLAFLVNLVVVPIFMATFPILFVGVILALAVSKVGIVLSFGGFGITAINWVAGLFAKNYFLVGLTPWKVYAVVAFFVVLFLFSKFLMLKKKARLICVTIGVTIFGGLFGVQYVPTAPAQTITFCTKYGMSSVLLTNRHKESVIINMRDFNFTYNMLMASEVEGVDAVFELNEENYESGDIKRLGDPQVIMCESANENVTSVNRNEEHVFKGFTFKFKDIGGQIVGLEISFDDTKVFVMSDHKISNSRVAQIAGNDYDFVMLNKRNDCADKFGEDVNVLGYYKSAATDWSVLKDGNVRYKWNGKYYVGRCLD